MRTAIDISGECLADLVGQLNLLAITVVGSLPSEHDRTVRLVIEGEWLPDAPLVTCEFHRIAINNTMQITAKVLPAD